MFAAVDVVDVVVVVIVENSRCEQKCAKKSGITQ